MAAVEGLPNRAQSLFVPLIVVLIILLGATGWMLMNKQQELRRTQAERSQALKQVAERDAHIQELELEIDENRKERLAMEDRLSELRTQLADSSKDIEHSRGVLQEMQQRYEATAKERDQFQAQIAGLSLERNDFRKQINDAEAVKKELERTASRLRERLALLDRDYQKLSQQFEEMRLAPSAALTVIGASGPGAKVGSASEQPSSGLSSPIAQAVVELPPIVVRKDQAGMAVPVRGRVLDVNAEHNFLVVDKGSVDGVRVGMAFDIVRGANNVGRVSVVRVRPQLAACDIIRSKTTGLVQSGDVVVQSGP